MRESPNQAHSPAPSPKRSMEAVFLILRPANRTIKSADPPIMRMDHRSGTKSKIA